MTPSEKLFELARGPMIDEKHNCKKEKEEFLRLLSEGADVNYINPKGYFELDSQYQEDCLFSAVTNHNYYIALLLVKYGAKYDNCLNGYYEHGYNALGALYDIFGYEDYNDTDKNQTVVLFKNILDKALEDKNYSSLFSIYDNLEFDYFDETDKIQAEVLFNYILDKAIEDKNYATIFTLYEYHSSLPIKYFERILSKDNGICFYKNELDTSLLELACDNDNEELIKLLVRNGAKANNDLIRHYIVTKKEFGERPNKYIVDLLRYNRDNERDDILEM